MATYNTITPISRTEWPGGNLAYGGTCTGSVPYPASSTSAYPISVSRVYTPYQILNTISDPTKDQGRNWKKIKESGHISFTDYSRSRTKIENFLVSTPYVWASWKFHQQGCTQSQTVNRLGPLEGYTKFNVNSTVVDFELDTTVGRLLRPFIVDHDSSVADAVSTTQQAAFANATSTYDALTEIVESGKTLEFLQSLVKGAAVALKKFADTAGPISNKARKLNAKQLLSSSDKSLQKLGSRWLAYRYAIMPIVYSIKDIHDLIAQADDQYKSGRDKQRISSSLTLEDYNLPAEGRVLVPTSEIVTTVRSLFKVRYMNGSLQRLFSQTSFNLFQTAWELIPFSFVVDWFINVGDSIVSVTRIDSSSESLGVTAVKTSRIDISTLHDSTVSRPSMKVDAWMNGPAITRSYTDTRNVHAVLQRLEIESYNRFIFTKSSPKLIFKPHLSWKRIIDGLALSQKPISKLLRSL